MSDTRNIPNQGAPRQSQAATGRLAGSIGNPTPETRERDMGKAGSVRVAVVALLLTVMSALAVFPFILPAIPA